VPTFAELGVQGYEVDLWYAFFVPTKTPNAVVNRLNSEIVAILQLPEVKDLLGKAGLDAASSTPEALGAVVAKDYPRWGAVIKRNGITAE
jgi:tripartite-type tricarboxylate transporter receptor subunit TctC